MAFLALLGILFLRGLVVHGLIEMHLYLLVIVLELVGIRVIDVDHLLILLVRNLPIHHIAPRIILSIGHVIRRR